MKPEKKNDPKQRSEDDLKAELDQLDDLCDKMLSRGDDDFYEAFRNNQPKNTQDERHARSKPKKRGRGI
jgi:hypothetical protein